MGDVEEENVDYDDEKVDEENAEVEEENADENADVEEENADVEEQNVNVEKKNPDDLLDEDEKRILSTIKDAIKERQLPNVIALLSPQDKEIGLLMAARTERLATLIELVVPGANVNCEDEDRNNVLHILLNTYRNKEGDRSRNDLLLQCVDVLIYAGADINKVNKENKTPLITAIDKDMLEVVVHMLDGTRLRTAEPNIHMGRDANTLCYLLLAYADKYFDQFEDHDITDDMYAYENDLLLQCVCKLVEAGVDVNVANEDGLTALLIAAHGGMFKVMAYLLENGARIVNDKDGNLLHIILRFFQFNRNDSEQCKVNDILSVDFLLPCVAKLVDAGVDLNEKASIDPDESDDEDGLTPIMMANSEDGLTPIMMAVSFGLYEVGLYLADHCIKGHTNTSEQSQLAELYFAILKTYARKSRGEKNDNFISQFIDKLVRGGLDINPPDRDLPPVSPLVAAVTRGVLQVAWALIENGANCPKYILCVLLKHYRNTGDHNSRDDLLMKCIDAIVDRNNATLHYKMPGDKETPLLIAARRPLIHVVMHLIDHGANVSCRNGGDFNALQLILGADTIDSNYRKEIKNIGEELLLECAVKLVEAGTPIGKLDVDDIDIEEPIDLASSSGWLEITIYLLDRWIGEHPVDEISQDTVLNILLESYRLKDRNKDKDDLLLGCVVRILEWYSEVDVTPVDEEHVEPALMTAARKGLLEVVMYLVDQGFDVHCLDTYKCNLLHILFKTNRNNSNDDLLLQCVRKLDEAGIDLNQMNLDGNAPVMVATERGLLDIVKYLIDHGAAVHYINPQGKNLFHILKLQDCSDGYQYTQIVKALIKMGLDVNQSDDEGNTPLYYTYCLLKDGEPDAMLELRYTLINLFINAGCNVNHQNKAGENLLMFFIKNQAPVRVIKLLIGFGTDLNVCDTTGDTACSYCVKYHIGDGTKVFKYLVESGTNLISVNTGIKLFHQILRCQRYKIFQYYMGLQLIVGGTTVDGETMNHLLAKLNHSYTFNAFSWLLNGEIDINQGCLHNTTPMMIASFLFNRNYLELLTQHSQISTNLQNDQGHTALHLCIVGFTILKEGFNKRHTGDEVMTLCEQIYPLYMECVDILIDHHIDVNIRDNSGKTALMFAAMKNDRMLMRKLLAAGAVVDILDYSGRSALQYLDIYKSVFDLTCFKLLLENGNNTILDIPCIDGNTIIQTVLCFPYFWKPREVDMLVKYLVGENCCLQRLETTKNESSFKLIDPDEFSDQERDRLRRLLYLSGAPKEQVLLALDFGDIKMGGNDQEETFYSRQAGLFHTFSNNLSLKCLSRRIIRQHLGLGIKEKIKKIDIPRELYDFLLLNDILGSKYFDKYLFDDGLSEYDDNDFDSYDVDQKRDDDYSQFNYEYFTLSTDDELKTLYEENGQVIGQDDDDKNDDDSSQGEDSDNDDDDVEDSDEDDEDSDEDDIFKMYDDNEGGSNDDDVEDSDEDDEDSDEDDIYKMYDDSEDDSNDDDDGKYDYGGSHGEYDDDDRYYDQYWDDIHKLYVPSDDDKKDICEASVDDGTNCSEAGSNNDVYDSDEDEDEAHDEYVDDDDIRDIYGDSEGDSNDDDDNQKGICETCVKGGTNCGSDHDCSESAGNDDGGFIGDCNLRKYGGSDGGVDNSGDDDSRNKSVDSDNRRGACGDDIQRTLGESDEDTQVVTGNGENDCHTSGFVVDNDRRVAYANIDKTRWKASCSNTDVRETGNRVENQRLADGSEGGGQPDTGRQASCSINVCEVGRNAHGREECNGGDGHNGRETSCCGSDDRQASNGNDDDAIEVCCSGGDDDESNDDDGSDDCERESSVSSNRKEDDDSNNDNRTDSGDCDVDFQRKSDESKEDTRAEGDGEDKYGAHGVADD